MKPIKVRRFLEQNPWLSGSLLFNLLYAVYCALRQTIWARRVGLRVVCPCQLRKYKSSDTLFILGAGASLNRLTPENWARISGCDVAGTTSTALLPVRQTYYFMEGSLDQLVVERHSRVVHREAMKRADQGLYDVLLWKYPRARQMADLFDMSRFVVPLLIDVIATSVGGLKRLVRFFRRTGLDRLVFVQKRASIFCLAWLGVVLGYRSIVFCGVDLIDSRYFYDAIGGYDGPTLPNLSANRDAVHETASADFGFPVHQALRCLADEYPAVGFFTASRNSLLAETFPVWEFE